MEHIYKEMMKGFLKKKYRTISREEGSLKNLGKLEIIEELFDYYGFGDIEDETLTADQIMIQQYKVH
jgi:hypothetical protein